MNFCSAVKSAREHKRLSHAEVAAAIGINVPSYWDLETYDDEIDYAVSMETLMRLAELLEVHPLALLGASALAEAAISPAAVADCLERIIGPNPGAAEAIETTVGYELGQFRSNPGSLREWNLDGVKQLADVLGVDWHLVIAGLFEDGRQLEVAQGQTVA